MSEKEKKKSAPIDPMKTALFWDVEDVKNLRGLYTLGLLSKPPVRKLIDTVQYLMEVIERMEENDLYVMSILTRDQTNQLMRDLHGWTDEDFKKSEQDAKEMLQNLKNKLFKNHEPTT